MELTVILISSTPAGDTARKLVRLRRQLRRQQRVLRQPQQQHRRRLQHLHPDLLQLPGPVLRRCLARLRVSEGNAD